MSLHPLDDRIVVRPGESEETTASGLVIPDTAKEKPQQGEVLAVGPGRRAESTGELVPLDIKKGDTVVYSKYGGTEIRAPRPRGGSQQARRDGQGHPRPEGPQRRDREEVRRTDHYQRRRLDRP